MVTFVNVLSRVLTRAGEYLWELGGSLEVWCDEQHWLKVQRGRD